jgi:hypothetical protein
MELMLNATTPLQMLAGKVIGNGGAGLTQYGTIMAAVIGGLLAQAPIHKLVVGTESASQFGGLDPVVLGAFVVLFVLGFLLYSLLYAALGSLVSRQEDVQSATSPLMMLCFLGYFGSIFALQAIDEVGVKIASFIPFFSPYLMLARVSSGHVEPWEFALALPPGSTAPGSCSTASESVSARSSERPGSPADGPLAEWISRRGARILAASGARSRALCRRRSCGTACRLLLCRSGPVVDTRGPLGDGSLRGVSRRAAAAGSERGLGGTGER